MMGVIKAVVLVVPVLISVAFMTLAERKVLSLIGLRQGPNKVSVQGVLQPMADALKLANKSVNIMSNYSMIMYYFSVFIMMFCSLMLWTSMPLSPGFVGWKHSFMILMLILGVASMKAIMAGWSTFGKYPLIGSMRTVSQMISYESVLYLCILTMIWCIKSFSMEEITNQGMVVLTLIIPLTLIFWAPSVMAELNRTPYDFSEGESELVSGFNTEFGSSSFTMIFLSEYSNIIFFMGLTSLMFANSSSGVTFLLSMLFLNFWIIWMRSTLPRMRFDKFMMKAWKFYIPFMTMVAVIILLEV